jgi:hypothetical protein
MVPKGWMLKQLSDIVKENILWNCSGGTTYS